MVTGSDTEAGVVVRVTVVDVVDVGVGDQSVSVAVGSREAMS